MKCERCQDTGEVIGSGLLPLRCPDCKPWTKADHDRAVDVMERAATPAEQEQVYRDAEEGP